MSSWSRWCDNGSRESYRQVYVKHGEVGVEALVGKAGAKNLVGALDRRGRQYY